MDLRRLDPDRDAFDELTTVLHRAYAPLGAAGMRFAATHQSVAVTRQRAAAGECWVGVEDGRLVATITVTPPGHAIDYGDLVARADVAKFGQMAVIPERKGAGLGRALLAKAEERARAWGAGVLACDTAVHARELLALYRRRGLRHVGFVDWRPFTDYLSAVLAKDLRNDAIPTPWSGWSRAPDDAWRSRPDVVRALTGGPDDTGVSTAFVEDDRAHVGVIEVAARLESRSVAIAELHGIVGPEDLVDVALDRALAHVDARVSTAIVRTSTPERFVGRGFRVVPDHRFRVRRPLQFGTAPPLRRPEPAALRRLLEDRTPASRRLAFEDEGWRWARAPQAVWLAEDLGVGIAWRRRGDRAELIDVIGPELPPLDAIAARLPADLVGMDLAFCPDRYGEPTTAIPAEGPAVCVRGPWPVAGPVAWPASMA